MIHTFKNTYWGVFNKLLNALLMLKMKFSIFCFSKKKLKNSQTWRAETPQYSRFSHVVFVKPLKNTILIFQKVFRNEQKILIFSLFSCIFWIVKNNYFVNILPRSERFEILVLTKFFIIFEKSIFCEKHENNITFSCSIKIPVLVTPPLF